MNIWVREPVAQGLQAGRAMTSYLADTGADSGELAGAIANSLDRVDILMRQGLRDFG